MNFPSKISSNYLTYLFFQCCITRQRYLDILNQKTCTSECLLLCVNKSTDISIAGLYRELGRVPLIIIRKVHTYWLNILKLY